jgi:phosphoribosyl isomerase A
MPLTLYPAVDIKDGRAVRLTQGAADAETVYDDDPVAAATRFADAGSTWLHVVDLDAAFTGEPRNRHLIEAIVAATGCRVQASGGVRTVDDVEASLGYGAERVVIGTMALTEPGFVADVLDRVGPRIAVGLDARGTVLQARGWTEEAGDLFAALDTFTRMGVPRFVYTDVAKDGMLQGPNVEMLTRVAEATDAAITASGGVSSLADLDTLAACHERVDAAIVGKALYSGAFTIDEALERCGG